MTDEEVKVITDLIRELGVGFCKFAIADAKSAENCAGIDGDRARTLIASASAWDAAASRTQELANIIETTLLEGDDATGGDDINRR
jgi:hypothetical protein